MENSNLTITIPASEFEELIMAKVGIGMIGNSIGKYGADNDVVRVVCKQFGYEYKEDEADA